MTHDTLLANKSPRSHALAAELSNLIKERQLAVGCNMTIARPVIESWERCVRYGLSPTSVVPKWVDTIQEDAHLISIASHVLEARQQYLRLTGTCLSLTDSSGVILRQWDGNRAVMERLERLSVVPGYMVSETTVGTSSGSSLISQRPTMVRGPEHFASQFAALTSAGTTITNPISRRIVGSLHLTSLYADSSPVALAWVCELVTDIERQLLDARSRTERLLMDSFLKENRDVRHAVVAVSNDTILTNKAAARLLAPMERLLLWEHASRALRRPDGRMLLPVADGVVVDVKCAAIHDDREVVGAVLQLKTVPDDRAIAARTVLKPIVGLAGNGMRWNAMLRRLAKADGPSVLLVGEPGVGKSAIARALSNSGASLDIDLAELRDDPDWSTTLAEQLSRTPDHVILRHIDELPAESAKQTLSILRKALPGGRVVATARVDLRTSGVDERISALFGAVVHVPALSDRTDDLPELVKYLTMRHLPPGREPIHWMPDALARLARIDWPENVASLELVVSQLVNRTSTGYIGASDLPSHLLVSGPARRKLQGLERVEASAIVQALEEAEGNKVQAADALGIARSTLYRKMRALGLDVDGSSL